MRYWFLCALLCCSTMTLAGNKVVLVSLDGVRWQEVFGGSDPQLIVSPAYVKQPQLIHTYSPGHAEQLMPFLHQTVAKHGVLAGDRNKNSSVSVTNPAQVSYPGYQELLAGFADPKLLSNADIPNPNPTVLEWLATEQARQVAVFGSWQLLPQILNTARSGLLVNAGFMPLQQLHTERVQYLNELQQKTPASFATVRPDIFTQEFALEYLRQKQPDVLYIALGEADDFAHQQQYDRYLQAIHHHDAFLAELWRTLQNLPAYRNQTTLLISTDHGRGLAEQWHRHGQTAALPGYPAPEGVPGSEQIWYAALGPGVPAAGLVQGEFQQGQLAATLAASLGLDYRAAQPKAAAALEFNSQFQLASDTAPAADHQGP
ncbi:MULTISPECIES: alkaline phosphatase family protein [Rheinheimera]|uniref:Alkaline phosphatase family protein n=1 Tax=Rheinheimera marina TaxID=1774958 RepID=A0ABV9JGV4_9GAMM